MTASAEVYDFSPNYSVKRPQTTLEIIEAAKQTIIGFANGDSDPWAKATAFSNLRELSDDETAAIGDLDSRTLVSYARLGIEPTDTMDVDGNIFSSWFETDAEYQDWSNSYQKKSFLYNQPSWQKEDSESTKELTFDKRAWANRTSKGKLGSGLLIGATLVALAFEQSPGNESVRATAALEVLENTSDPIAAGIMVAGLTVAIEGVTGMLISAGLNREKKILRPKLEKFRDKLIDEDENDDEKGRVGEVVAGLTDTGITCTIGPGMVVARRHFQEDDRTFNKDMKTLAGYTGVGAGVSGLIGYLATGGVKHADKVGLGTPAEYFVDYATDWKFWTGLLTVGYGGKWIYGKAKKLKQKLGAKSAQTELVDPQVSEQ